MKIHSQVSEVINHLADNQSVLVHGAMATPLVLLDELKKQAERFSNLELMHLHTEGEAFYTKEEFRERFQTVNFFTGANARKNFDYHRNDYLPCFLSEIPYLIRHEKRKVDVVLIHVSPPNKHGFCSLGTSVDIMLAGLDKSKLVLAQINKQMPCVHGDALIHVDQIDHAVEIDEALPTHARLKISEEEDKIGQHIASLIEDRSCLQMGIGAIPDAVLKRLTGHKDLGIHTEMFSDGLVDLYQTGAITNRYKKIHPGKIISSFVAGSQELLDFIDDNPLVNLLPSDYVNYPANIARNERVVAINSAIEVDLTGQVCADSIGHRQFSGVGGQMDFIRGASMSRGGVPIIALSSRTKKGQSKITAALKSGAGVVTTRAHTHYVVTEFGVANLYGLTLGERAKAMIEIAHPDDRETLERQWFDSH